MVSSYAHLSFQERIRIAKWRDAKMPVPEIADRLGRAPSTIYRELRRNHFDDKEVPELAGYYAMNAQKFYEERRAIHRKLIRHPEIKAAIEDALKNGWSPEQIAGRMRLECHPIRVSHETIYRYAYSRDGRAEQFHRHCRNIGDAADRVATDVINADISLIAKAFETGPKSWPHAPSLATGNAT